MPDLEYLLAQARRIQEHREANAEVGIRKAFKGLLKNLQGFLGVEYANNAENGELSYATLQKKARYARFLSEVEDKVIKGTAEHNKIIKDTVNNTYKAAFNGMIDAVKKTDGKSKELKKVFESVKYVRPETLKDAVNNPVSGLTLNDNLEKNRAEIVYNIKQTIGIGLQNGDRYETMAKRVAESLDNDYNKAIRIVRTETHRVQQSGKLESIIELDKKLQQGNSGMRYFKIWKTAKDERVRRPKGKNKANHQKMEGVEILCDEYFDLGHGIKTMAPGQSGNAADDINCRCRLSFRLKKVDKFVGEKYANARENIGNTSEKIEKPFTSDDESVKIKSDEKLSELGKFKEKIFTDKRMGKQYYKAVKNKFSQGNETAKKVFNKFVPKDSVDDAEYIKVPCFDPNTKKIYMNYNVDLNNERGKSVTYYQEHGHLIDCMAGEISKDEMFSKLLYKDKMLYVKSVGKANNLKTFPKVYEHISNELNNMRKHSAVSDILQGLTGGQIQGISGHNLSYWENGDNITSEAFAHMFEAQFDKERYEEMKKVFPNALKYFEEKLKGVL